MLTSANDVEYTNPIKRTDSVDQAVIAYSKTDTRDIASARVNCTPRPELVTPLSLPLSAHNLHSKRGENTWHTGGTDPNAPEHVTVVYEDSNGQHVTVKHVGRNGKAV